MDIDLRISDVYEDFQGFPTNHNAIVRFGHVNDAFTIVVFEILFKDYHQTNKFIRSEPQHLELLEQSIVPAPDDSIDIFFEEIDSDEYFYHIVQVKNTSLNQSEIAAAFLLMEEAINNYLKKPEKIRKQLKTIIANTAFTKSYKNSCIYYVVHAGKEHFTRFQKANQKVVTKDELELLKKASWNNGTYSVPKEVFELDEANNFIINNFVNKKVANSEESTVSNLPQSILCNFNGYDLAMLHNKYANTLLGRNILYGLNLRESLSKKSKTFDKMFDTIENEPELFLFYNNGITIISSDFDNKSIDGKDRLIVENFSIINGAQTTSTLGEYLKNSYINNRPEKIENLKKVFVLTKIYQINNTLINQDKISERIKIYNNTQTPLSSRDLVSIRDEQIALQERLSNRESEPNIFMFIKKGEQVRSSPKTYPHQRITNEVLAQLSLCGFYFEPQGAKDKKLAIFENDNKDDVLLNTTYDKIFSPNRGVLFLRSVSEIDELLFVYRVHNDTKKFLKTFFKNFISSISQSPINNQYEKNKQAQIEKIKRDQEIANACLFFNITTYYQIKMMFEGLFHVNTGQSFDYTHYYSIKNSPYRENIIKSFYDLFLKLTIEVIRTGVGNDNIVNWLRLEKNQGIFLEILSNQLNSNAISIADNYQKFFNTYRVVKNGT